MIISFINQDDPDHSQIISKMISVCTTNRKYLLPLDEHIQNSQASGLGVRKVDISSPYTPSANRLIGSLQTVNSHSNHSGYFTVQVRSKTSNPLFTHLIIDMGNNTPFDCAVQKALALKIDCQILIKSMQVGLASA